MARVSLNSPNTFESMSARQRDIEGEWDDIEKGAQGQIDSMKPPAERIFANLKSGKIDEAEALEQLEDADLITFSTIDYRQEAQTTAQYVDRIRYSLISNLKESPEFGERFFQGLMDDKTYLFKIRSDDLMPESGATEAMTANNVVQFSYSEDLVHTNFARQGEFRDGMNQREYRNHVIYEQFSDGVPDAPENDMSQDEVNSVLKDSNSSGEEIVDALVSSGRLSFTGTNSENLRPMVEDLLNGSSFFKRSFTEGFLHDSERAVDMSTSDLKVGIGGYAANQAGRRLVVVPETRANKNPSDTDRYVVAHELLHATADLEDSVDMQMASSVVLHELGIDPGNVGAGGVIGTEGKFDPEGFDYDLFQAAREDFKAAGALRQEDYYDFETPEAKKALEKILGRPLQEGDSIQGAFNASSNLYEDDVSKIVASYINALDGGKVEKLRAQQLKDMGYGDLLETLPKNSGDISLLVDGFQENIDLSKQETPDFWGDDAKFKNMREAIEDAFFYVLLTDPDKSDLEVIQSVLKRVDAELKEAYGNEDDAAKASQLIWQEFTSNPTGLGDIVKEARGEVEALL